MITKGADGALVSDKDVLYNAFACRVKVVDKTGAGMPLCWLCFRTLLTLMSEWG